MASDAVCGTGSSWVMVVVMACSFRNGLAAASRTKPQAAAVAPMARRRRQVLLRILAGCFALSGVIVGSLFEEGAGADAHRIGCAMTIRAQEARSDCTMVSSTRWYQAAGGVAHAGADTHADRHESMM